MRSFAQGVTEEPTMVDQALTYLQQLNQLQQGNEQVASSRQRRQSDRALLPGQIEQQGATTRGIGARASVDEATAPTIGPHAQSMLEQAASQTRHLDQQTNALDTLTPAQYAEIMARVSQSKAATDTENALRPGQIKLQKKQGGHLQSQTDINRATEPTIAPHAQALIDQAQAGIRHSDQDVAASKVLTPAHAALMGAQASGLPEETAAKTDYYKTGGTHNLIEPSMLATRDPAMAHLMETRHPGSGFNAMKTWWSQIPEPTRQALIRNYPDLQKLFTQ